jgi:TonB family protein
MAHSPLQGPEFPAVAEPPVLPQLDSPTSAQVAAARDDADAIFSALGDFIAGTQDVDVILGAIAEAAQRLTQSGGVAIAMRRNEVVVCLGRSGEMAPPLGTRLGVDSGISGECLRTGNTLRCDDASKDYRADQEVCRKLGLRSIAAVPMRQGAQSVGILEAFSSQRCAFAEEHMDFLTRLARLAEAAAFESREEVQSPPTSHEGADLDSPPPLSQARSKVAMPPPKGLQSEHRQYYRVAAVVVAMLSLFSVVGWRMRRNSAGGMPRSAPLPATAVPAPPMPQSETTEVLSMVAPATKPNPARSRTEADTARPLDTIQRASKTEVAPLATSRSDAPDSEEHSAPPAPRPATDASKLVSLLSVPATLPQFAASVSQGFSGGVLAHKVQPTYPRQAIPLRLEGSVLLQATVAENGAVRDLKVTSGHPMLARAAVAAVSQWRYRPFLLNGKPIQQQVNISIDFKAPR